MSEITHGSLFSGIGGFDLGFERAGFRTVWQVEIDPYCRKVLEKNFPHAKRFDDIHDVVRWHHLDWVDVISGGFPCQDISNAGKRRGIDGERSGLWSEMRRVIHAMAPRFVIVENVAALLNRGVERVLGDLAEIGYDAEWDVLPASAFGAPHRRDRVFILAYSNCSGFRWSKFADENNRPFVSRGRETCVDVGKSGHEESGIVANTERFSGQVRTTERERLGRLTGGGEEVANADRTGCVQQRRTSSASTQYIPPKCSGSILANPPSDRLEEGWQTARIRSDGFTQSDWWAVEPDLGRVAHGVPNRVDRLKGLGNAVVPQIAEWIAHRIRAVIEVAQ